MTRLPVAAACQDFAEVVNRVANGGDRVVVEDQGRDLVAVISVQDLELFDRLLEEYEDQRDLEAARDALKEPGSVPWSEVKARLGL